MNGLDVAIAMALKLIYKSIYTSKGRNMVVLAWIIIHNPTKYILSLRGFHLTNVTTYCTINITITAFSRKARLLFCSFFYFSTWFEIRILRSHRKTSCSKVQTFDK